MNAALGHIVTVRFPGEEPDTNLLAFREEAGGDYQTLDPKSPVGRAILGHGAGERVSVRAPVGSLVVELVDVRTKK